VGSAPSARRPDQPGRVAPAGGRSTAAARRRPAADAHPLPASVGTRFTLGGHDHAVVEVTGSGVRARVGGGPATATIAFGTMVSAEGRLSMVAHPRSAEAWDRLRAWRAERAKASGKPAFVVLDDKTLRLVAAVLPTDEAGLVALSGIGPVKLESYGDDLILMAERLRTGDGG
jgi:superfamily II DNA helicase RecQ